jgi:SAM-dependent methyltransferase/uncharacterized protein YbaR (Trm112 family)
MLDILECPYCGGGLRLQEDPAALVRGGSSTGILSCGCCAYPVVDGIPYVQTGPAAGRAMALLGEGRADEARLMMLGLDGDADRRRGFERLLERGDELTFRSALEVLSRDAEGDYLLHRFSDPTFLAGDALLRALGSSAEAPPAGPALDLCGGAGHLTRTLCGASPGRHVVLADIAYWKLWLAARFVAPACDAVCCDASQPLPFARASFALLCCSDAFHYVWPRRLLAAEMMRAAAPDGVIVLPHLHNAACDNPSAGMPLTAAAYRHLFHERQPRLFAERPVFEAVLAGASVELTGDARDDDLAGEPNLILIAAKPEVFRSYAPSTGAPRAGRLAVNPLYRPANHGESVHGCGVLELRFPSDFYEQEFAAALRYLPRRVEIPSGALDHWGAGATDSLREQLTRQRVLLDLPARYA